MKVRLVMRCGCTREIESPTEPPTRYIYIPLHVDPIAADPFKARAYFDDHKGDRRCFEERGLDEDGVPRFMEVTEQ